MKKQHADSTTPIEPSPYGYPMMYQQEDEIDLFELFSSIFKQWKLMALITAVGTILTIIVALLIPKQYDAVVQVARPVAADIKALNTQGYEQYSPSGVFVRYYDLLRSTEYLKGFLKSNNWYKELFPYEADENKLLNGFLEQFEVEVIESDNEIQEGVSISGIKRLNVKLVGENEQKIVKFVNDYVKYTNKMVLQELKQKGVLSVALEGKKIEKSIAELREDAKVKREFLISKKEEQNNEKLAVLQTEKKLLLAKATEDTRSKIAVLEEAYKIAKKAGIKKLTTINALATDNKSATSLISVVGRDNQINALMGTNYLNSQLEALKNRTSEEPFIPRLAQINKQMEEIKFDATIVALKQRKSDDPYIEQLPDLLSRLRQLKAIDFDFKGMQLYRLDQAAYISDTAVKPNKKLIVIVGFVLSGFISLFVVLIVNGIANRQEQESSE